MFVEQLTFNAPLDVARAERLLTQLAVQPSSRVLDVGCGRGELLTRLVARSGCLGVGVDPKASEVELAVRRSQGMHGRLTWHAARIQDAGVLRSFDAAICIAATHAFGPPGQALPRALEALSGMVVRGGRLLIGEGFWKQEPAAGYLAATGFECHHLTDHAGNLRLGEAAGLGILHHETSSLDEWDEFEAMFWRAAEEARRQAPEDDVVRAQAEHWRKWRAAYETWGRDTLGFGYYVFEVLRSPEPG